jgi:hypothetical protein
MLYYDQQSIGQSVLVSVTHLGPATNSSARGQCFLNGKYRSLSTVACCILSRIIATARVSANQETPLSCAVLLRCWTRICLATTSPPVPILRHSAILSQYFQLSCHTGAIPKVAIEIKIVAAILYNLYCFCLGLRNSERQLHRATLHYEMTE